MKGIISKVHVLCFLIGIIELSLFVAAMEKSEPKQDWNSQEVSQLMKLLMKYGNNKLQEINSNIKNKEKHVSQYLVASVLSESEMIDSKNWEHLPDSLTKDNARVDIIVNDQKYQNFPYKTKKPLHGEVLMLLEREDLPKMINNLNKEQGNTSPYVVLYSHYIPCCDVKGIEYSCSEELANAAISNHDKYTMLVGYNEVFSNTNPDKSRAFMSMGGIKLFKFENGIFNPEYANYDISEKPERLFQDLFYNCLDITPVSEDCCVAEKSQPKHKKKILAMYVNNVVYLCTTNSLKSYMGKLTPAHSLAIMQCIYNFVDKHTSQDCPKLYCAAPTTINTIKVCALYASEFGTEIGRPLNLNDPYLPVWEKGNVVWGFLYRGYNVDADKNRPAVFCLKKTNDIKSLCTQMKISNEEITDTFRGREKKLKNELKSKRRNPM